MRFVPYTATNVSMVVFLLAKLARSCGSWVKFGWTEVSVSMRVTFHNMFEGARSSTVSRLKFLSGTVSKVVSIDVIPLFVLVSHFLTCLLE